MEDWLKNSVVTAANTNAEYLETINMDDIKESILCCPNDPDDAKLLSEVQGQKLDEVFISSCMTNIGHYRAAGKMLNMMRASFQHDCGLHHPPRWTMNS